MHFLVSLNSQMDKATTNGHIDSILDTSEYMEIINCSGWPCTEPITMYNKPLLLQGLITEEVIRKRVRPMNEMREGLRLVGLFPFLQVLLFCIEI